MGGIEKIILEENTQCNGCDVQMKKGDSAIRYENNSYIAIHHSQGCLDASMDYYIETEDIGLPENDPIVQKVLEEIKQKYKIKL